MKPAVCSDKQCQEFQNVHMQPVKPAKELNHMQSVTRSSNMKSIKPEILQSSSKQKKPVKQESVCCDKNHQVNMWPVKPEMDMWSREPAMKQPTYKFNQDDKNCQSTKSIESVYDD